MCRNVLMLVLVMVRVLVLVPVLVLVLLLMPVLVLVLTAVGRVAPTPRKSVNFLICES